MKKLKKLFSSFTINAIIFAMLGGLCLLTLENEVRTVFYPTNENIYYWGDSSQKQISLMFNVYWGNEYLPSILESLEDYQVKTTFFVGGSWVTRWSDDFMLIVEKGHEIGNHGFYHKEHQQLDYASNQQEIFNTHKIVKEYTGKNMNLFAPPSGSYNKNTLLVANNLGYKMIMWSRDTIDWRDRDANIIYQRATKNLGSGELILMHPTEATAIALPQILEYCQKNQLKVVPVSQNIIV